MEKLSGGELLIRTLAEEGVECVFGYPGGAVLHIYDALFKQDAIEHILVRHEQGATHAADGYARATGRPGVVLVTSGPGVTNAITGLATAHMDSIPMVVICGQVQSHLIGTDSFQETDALGISLPLVKHSYLADRAEDIPRIVREAFYIANSGRPGPVLIDIPKDVTSPLETYPYQRSAGEVRLRSYQPPVRGHSGQIRKAVDLLLSAERPVIYSGGGVVQGEGSEQLRALQAELNFPITSTLMGLGAFVGTHEAFLGMLGMHGTYQANMAMHHCDLILAIGARFDDRVTNTPDKFAPDASIIQVDVDPASIAKIIPVDVPIVGPVRPVLEDMLAEIRARNQRSSPEGLASWHAQIAEWRDRHGLDHEQADRKHPRNLIYPQQVVQSLYRATGGRAHITSDVGQHQMFVAQYYHFDEPRRWINSGGLGTMGFGLPAAMGVQRAFPEATVVCVTGEGSFQMCLQEMSTCTQYGLPVKIINLNNQALGMVRQWQDMQYGGRYSGSTYKDSLPDFVRLAEAYGHLGLRVERPEELDAAMARCFAEENRDRLVLLDVMIDPDEHVYPMLVAPNGAMNDMWLARDERT